MVATIMGTIIATISHGITTLPISLPTCDMRLFDYGDELSHPNLSLFLSLSRGEGSWTRIEIAAILAVNANEIECEKEREGERVLAQIPLAGIEKKRSASRYIIERRLYIERYPARCLSQEDEGRTRGRNVTPRAATSYIYVYAWLTLRRRSRIYPIRETAHYPPILTHRLFSSLP